ncbi:MAG: HAMP domain-containing protein [Desulfobulbaceae bacterium]
MFGATSSTDSLLGGFLQKCLDTSITGKLIGMLVVSLLGFLLLITFNMVALQRIAERNHVIRDITNPQYKVSQTILRNINGFKISLLHILNAAQLQEDNRNVAANKQRLTDLKTMINALQNGGPILDVARVANKTLDVFTVQKTDNSEMNTLFSSLAQESILLEQAFQSLTVCLLDQCPTDKQETLLTELVATLDKTYDLVINMTVELGKQRTDQFGELEVIISTTTSRSIIIGSCIAVVLTIATLLYILLIATPLRDILKKITFIAKGDSERYQKITVKSNDEVGQLAHQLNIMVDNTFSLNTF